MSPKVIQRTLLRWAPLDPEGILYLLFLKAVCILEGTQERLLSLLAKASPMNPRDAAIRTGSVATKGELLHNVTNKPEDASYLPGREPLPSVRLGSSFVCEDCSPRALQRRFLRARNRAALS